MKYAQINEPNLRKYEPTFRGIYSIPIYSSQKPNLEEPNSPLFEDAVSFKDAFGLDRILLMPNHDGTGPRGGGKQDGSGNGNKGNQGTRNGGNQGNSGQGSKSGGQKGNC